MQVRLRLFNLQNKSYSPIDLHFTTISAWTMLIHCAILSFKIYRHYKEVDLVVLKKEEMDTDSYDAIYYSKKYKIPILGLCVDVDESPENIVHST